MPAQEMSHPRELTIRLEEEDWRKFVARNPDPVGWLRRQIQRSIAAADKKRTSH